MADHENNENNEKDEQDVWDQIIENMLRDNKDGIMDELDDDVEEEQEEEAENSDKDEGGEDSLLQDSDFLNLMKRLEQRHRQQDDDDDDDDDDDGDDDDLDDIGDADDYHNKSCDYARRSDFRRAAAVCEAGLKKFPTNADLIADLINYYSKQADFQETHRCLELQVQRLPRTAWSWRSFTFAIDALLAESAYANEAMLRELVADYQKFMPFEERAYMAEHDVAKALGNDAEAIGALEKAARVHPAAESCCRHLADYLVERGDFQRAREIAMRGIAASAQSQPSVRTCYCALLIALCDDALLWLDYAAGKPVEEAKVRRVLSEYEALDRFRAKLVPYQGQIEDRKGLLNFLLITCPQGTPSEADA